MRIVLALLLLTATADARKMSPNHRVAKQLADQEFGCQMKAITDVQTSMIGTEVRGTCRDPYIGVMKYFSCLCNQDGTGCTCFAHVPGEQ